MEELYKKDFNEPDYYDGVVYKKDFNEPDYYDGVVSHPESDILESKVK